MASKTNSTTSKTRSRRPVAAKTAAKPVAKKAAKPVAKATPAKAAKQPVERHARGRDPESVKRLPAILKRVGAGESVSAIAKDLGTTPGNVAWQLMLNRVDTGEVSAITFKDDADLVKVIRREREAGGELSAWHWIAARTGVAEGKVKAIAQANGFFTKGQNVAVARAAAKPKAAPAGKGTTKAAAKKAASKGRKATANPS